MGNVQTRITDNTLADIHLSNVSNADLASRLNSVGVFTGIEQTYQPATSNTTFRIASNLVTINVVSNWTTTRISALPPNDFVGNIIIRIVKQGNTQVVISELPRYVSPRGVGTDILNVVAFSDGPLELLSWNIDV